MSDEVTEADVAALSDADLLIAHMVLDGYLLPQPSGLYCLGEEPPPDAPEPVRWFWNYLYGENVKRAFAAAMAE